MNRLTTDKRRQVIAALVEGSALIVLTHTSTTCSSAALTDDLICDSLNSI